MVCKGTEYQTKKCERANTKAEDDYQRASAEWKKANADATERWKRNTLGTLTRLARKAQTEEAPNNDWDLRGAFLQVGQLLSALATPTRCVVLLGGVAVRNPPDHLRADLLAGTSVIIPGWHGTQDVQDRWSRKLSDAGASPVFLPQAITDLALVDRVRTCLKQA
jgi:hypothetical protein